MKSVFRYLLSIAVIGATVYFFAYALIQNWESISDISFTPNIHSIVGTFLFMLAVISSGLLWGSVLNSLSSGIQISASDAIKVYSASWLLKYIPGQAGSYLNKLAWGIKHGFSKKAVTNSFIYENVLLFFASVIPTFPLILLAFSEDASGTYQLFMPLLIAFPFLIVLNRNVFYRCLNWLSNKLRKQNISKQLFLSTRQLISFQAKYLIPRIINGLGFVFITQSLFSLSVGMYAPLAAIYVLAGIVGLLAIFVPSGIGVREAVIVLFATQYFSVEESIVLALVARFYATIADAGVALVYLYFNDWKLVQQ